MQILNAKKMGYLRNNFYRKIQLNDFRQLKNQFLKDHNANQIISELEQKIEQLNEQINEFEVKNKEIKRNRTPVSEMKVMRNY
jgi:hypothetical protein